MRSFYIETIFEVRFIFKLTAKIVIFKRLCHDNEISVSFESFSLIMHNVFVIIECRRLNSDKVRVGAGVRTIDDKGFFSLLTIVWVEV
jgi:hypothetical protein